MAMKINIDLGFLNNLFKSSKSSGNSVQSGSGLQKPSAKPISQPQHQVPNKSSEFEEKLKREFNYYVEYLKNEKSAKILLGLLSFFILSSIVYFAFFSDAPLIFNILAIVFIIIIGAGAFFLELMLLTRRQFLVGVFVVDAYFFVYKSIMKQLKKHPKRTPWLLEKFKSILRINAPFFRRVTKEHYAKMTSKEKEIYMKKYNDYLKKLSKTTESDKKEVHTQVLQQKPVQKTIPIQALKPQTKPSFSLSGLFGKKK